ncbi:hypothetical protein [Allobranchiibius huperziae]|uniref:Uncharacterized protein n=1 Tax=Allobranchiibius huperziae TaxID=1874116 RepID=A0A853DCF1_9MICO|nr:hypothetical protein [Allobranchiibius huperziae]NYJ73669.1 hypothetical protein [Allobranchiibius huperziae]
MDNPSSLIFVAIVVVWAGWLLQHQIRRRQVLLTARTVETFSDAMRVLERRTPVTVDASDSHAAERTSLRAGTVIHGEHPVHDEPQLPAHHSNEVAMSADSPMTDKLHHVLDRARTVAGQRRTRGIAFLVAAGLLPLTLLLVVAGAVSWLAIVASLMLLGAVLLWLRAETVAEQRRAGHDAPAVRRTTPQSRPQQPRQAAQPVRRRRPVAERHDDETHVELIRWDDVPFDAQPAPVRAQQAPAARTNESVEVEKVATPTVDAPESPVPAASVTAQSAPDGTWSPVQVPKPTYTMKAKAPERAPAAPASYENVPVQELPFDGMALDPEVEELPSAFRAG